MAHDGTGAGWDTAAPANSDARKDGAKEIRDLRLGIEGRHNKEHTALVASAAKGDVNAGGEHKAGSAKAYYVGVDDSTKRPDGVTALTTADKGRLRINGGLIEYWNGTTWVAGSTAASYSVAVLSHVLSAGTSGGSITSAGSWTTRPLNTESDPSAIVTLAANDFTLAAGTYEIEADSPIYAGDAHQSRLFNVTDSITTSLGSCEFSPSSSPFGQSSSKIRVVFTIAGSKAFRIQHRVTVNSQFGKAPASAFGVSTVFGQVVIRKLA